MNKKTLFSLLGLLVICLILIFIVFNRQDQNNLAIIFFDIGQGDAIFIRTPSNHTILIDGGPDATVLSKLGRAMPFYDHTIDLMVLTHAHSDHVAGLVEAVKRYDVEQVLYTGVQHNSPDFLAWRDLIAEKDIEMSIPMAGQVFHFADTSLEVLYPFEDISDRQFDDLNDTSIVTRLIYGDISFLLTGDASAEVEEEMLEFYYQAEARASAYPLMSDVLKVGHHGSKYSSSLEFVKTVEPEYAVIQSGRDNRFGHPHRMILKRLTGLGIKILRNDELGDVKMVSDGKELWVE